MAHVRYCTCEPPHLAKPSLHVWLLNSKATPDASRALLGFGSRTAELFAVQSLALTIVSTPLVEQLALSLNLVLARACLCCAHV